MRRIWRKIHIWIEEETLEMRAFGVTTSTVGDAPMLLELLNQVPPDQNIGLVTADGAYDTRKCHDAFAACGAHAVIPFRKKCKAMEADERQGHRQKRSSQCIATPGSRLAATLLSSILRMRLPSNG